MKMWMYTFDGYARGIVFANNANEAAEKVVYAYKLHSGYDGEVTRDMVRIEEADNCWFSDCPDVVEVSGIED